MAYNLKRMVNVLGTAQLTRALQRNLSKQSCRLKSARDRVSGRRSLSSFVTASFLLLHPPLRYTNCIWKARRFAPEAVLPRWSGVGMRQEIGIIIATLRALARFSIGEESPSSATIAGLDFGDFEGSHIDLFGDAYEFLISNYAANAGKSGASSSRRNMCPS